MSHWRHRPTTAIVAAATLLLSFVAAACGPSAAASPTSGSAANGVASPIPTVGGSGSQSTQPASPSTGPSADPSAESGGLTTAGDIPDNAMFLKYRGTNPTFSIEYVEGWQVTPRADGVVIRDKDSSETVTVVSGTTDPTAYTSTTLRPALQATAGFSFVKQDTKAVGAHRYLHLVYHLPSPPDPVTGKQVPSTVDAYVVAGPSGLAVVSLSTPDGVDNVDAFRRLIESFSWT